MTYSGRSGFATLVVGLVIAGGACTPMTPAASSSRVLTPERSWVIVSKPAQPAALDVVRMFTVRGFPLVDATNDGRGITLRFKGHRKYATEQIVTGLDVALAVAEVAAELSESEKKRGRRHHHHHHEPRIEEYEIGSAFYVRLEPRGETMTSISAIGRPTRSGVDACTPDEGLIAPCTTFEAGPSVHPDIAGIAEAELISGVFAEMRLGGFVVAPDEATMAAADASRKCWNRRREVEAAAARVSNPRAKAGIMRTAPDCAIGLAAN